MHRVALSGCFASFMNEQGTGQHARAGALQHGRLKVCRSAQGLCAQGAAFPPALAAYFVAFLDGTDAAQRVRAMSLAAAALQQVDGQLPDAQSQKLLLAAWQEVSQLTITPDLSACNLAGKGTNDAAGLRVSRLMARHVSCFHAAH